MGPTRFLLQTAFQTIQPTMQTLLQITSLKVLSHWPHVATHVATQVAQLIARHVFQWNRSHWRHVRQLVWQHVWQHVASVKAL